jgi:histidine triad (HIT) family protein
MNACVFCEIIAGNAEASLVYQDKLSIAFMDIRPVNPGHILVVPKQHSAGIVGLPEETGGHLFRVAQKLTAALYSSGLRCEGVNFFLADGEAAGQEVFHVHLHVLPRFSGDGFGLVFGPGYSRLPDRSQLELNAQMIRNALRRPGPG